MTISYAKYPNITTSLISYLDLIFSTFLPSSITISKEILSKILGNLITGEESVYGGMMEEAFLLLDGHKVKEAFEILKKLVKIVE